MLHLPRCWQEVPSASETHDTWCRTAYANMRNGRAQAAVSLALRYVRDKVCVHACAHTCVNACVCVRTKLHAAARHHPPVPQILLRLYFSWRY